MDKSTVGILAGSVVGAIGISYMMMDKRSRNRAMKDSKNLMKKGKSFMSDML